MRYCKLLTPTSFWREADIFKKNDQTSFDDSRYWFWKTLSQYKMIFVINHINDKLWISFRPVHDNYREMLRSENESSASRLVSSFFLMTIIITKFTHFNFESNGTVAKKLLDLSPYPHLWPVKEKYISSLIFDTLMRIVLVLLYIAVLHLLL